MMKYFSYRCTCLLAFLFQRSHHLAVNAQMQPRIVGGQQAKIGEFPYFVWLGGTCGASLIAKGVVLTAAHCADGGSLLGSFASVGAFDADGVLVVAVKSRITDQFIHPSYDASTISNDYMLLRLEVPVDLPPTNDGTSGVLTLNYDDTVPANGQSLTVMGLGLEAEGNWDGADALRYVVVKKIAYKVCTKSYDGEVQEDSMFCAGVDGGGKDSCQGDSGGPIVVRKGNQHIQVGIVSWGEGCARADFPGVYSRISHVNGWIESVVCGCWGVESASFCQGFVDNGEECPTPSPVFVPDPDCEDYDGYTDEFGDPCSWYILNDSPSCPRYGTVPGGDGFQDILPVEACCYCGGGGERGPIVAPVPTSSPTSYIIDPDCDDYVGFVDTYGDECSWYIINDEPGCPINGFSFGANGFQDVTANDACCYCGGGGDRGPTPAPVPTVLPTPFVIPENCENLPGWIDSFEDDCAWYDVNDLQGCPINGQETGGDGFNGITAEQACCHCGGGANSPTAAPVVTPPPTPFKIDPNCQDLSSWVDSYEDPCSWYQDNGSPGCPEYGEIVGVFEFASVTAKEACCYCGGGSNTAAPVPSPTPFPVDPTPTLAPTKFYVDPNCIDYGDYADVFGDDCKWYSLNDEPGCPLWGHYGGGTGFEEFSATIACCHCGGGLDRNTIPSTASPVIDNATTAPTVTSKPSMTASPTTTPTPNQAASSASKDRLWKMKLLLATALLGLWCS